ncbi:ATP-grasp domain-containing protein [Flavipsychrobacter stenotrophus]|uniref:hypothetical protein n=1 Tax=Flavipsychrobacter stenotrophus TaxID=2077091 RepID=UPI001374E2BC|nr:hypothetical protein [Flavipsychrobacter stenotrophus]
MKELPAILKKSNCQVDIFSAGNSWVLHNGYYDNWIEAPADITAFIEHLLDFLKANFHNYWWIIPGDDITLRILNDRITDEALFYKVMPLTKIENRALLGSKAGLAELCTKYSIKSPKQLVYNDNLSNSQISNYLGFPLMVKVDESEGGYGVFKCNNEQDLERRLAEITHKKNLVFQQVIIGEDINTEALYKNGSLVVYNYSLSTKTIGNFGISTRRVFIHNDDLDDTLKNIGKDLGLNGFGNIVFMRESNTGEYYLIEIDMRPNSWMYYGKFTGNDFIQGIKNIMQDKFDLIKPPINIKNKEQIIGIYKKDVYRCITTKDFNGLFYWLLNKNGSWRYIPLHDKVLFRKVNKFLLDTLSMYIGNLFRRKKKWA